MTAARRRPGPRRPPRGPDGARPDGLLRALGRAGVLTGPAADHALEAGRLAIDGVTARSALTPVRPGSRVTLDGRPVSLDFRTIALLLHKPAGLVTAPVDPEGVGTVFDALAARLPPELRNFTWHAVGRLDRNTTGLLLFTNDERLVEHATRPETKLPKRYLADTGADVTPETLAPLCTGVALPNGELVRAREAVVLGPRRVALVIAQGRNHQVKHMLAAVKAPVLRLHREAVGDLRCDVEEGALRRLSDEELRGALGYEPRGPTSTA